jgi:hypothetical protein
LVTCPRRELCKKRIEIITGASSGMRSAKQGRHQIHRRKYSNATALKSVSFRHKIPL